MNGHITNGANGVDRSPRNDDKAVQFLHRISKLLIEKSFRASTNTKTTKVVDFMQPNELREKFDFEIGAKGVDDDTLVRYCEDTIKYSVKTGHPHFYNQLFQGQDEHGLAGTWLVDAVNTSAYTYEVAPVFTLMEHRVLLKMRELMGYKTGDGIFCPGGSISNMYGMNLARYKMFPEVKAEGNWAAPRLCFFASEQSHYSLKKGAGFMGIGVNNLIFVKTNKHGQMDVQDLQTKILTAQAEGRQPFLVVATSGTTVLGAFDPLNDIADVCEKHKLWLHVDCCWGGSVKLSRTHQHLMNGIERSDSLAWNPHKMMGSPLQCCAFLTKHENMLQECHSANATYLFQQDKNYDVSYDTGDKSLQCGRKVDVFKLWLMWKAKGDLGFESNIDNIMARTQYIMQKMRKHTGFRLVLDPVECTNVCFWYIPQSMRGQEETEEWWQKLSLVAPKIKERMMEQGTMLIGYQPLGKRVNFFRLVISNLDSTDADMDFVVNEIDRLGADL